MKQFKFLLFIGLLTFNTCTISTKYNFVDFYKDNINQQIKNGVYLIIPSNACSACIYELLDFINKEDIKKVNLILLAKKSVELAPYKKYLENNNHQYLFSEEIYELNDIDGSAPVIFEINDGKLISTTIVHIDKNIFLAKYILSKYR